MGVEVELVQIRKEKKGCLSELQELEIVEFAYNFLPRANLLNKTEGKNMKNP